MLRNVFLITSAINTPLGLIHPDDRFLQTVEQLQMIKIQDPESLIILIDNSPTPLPCSQIQQLKTLTDYFIYTGWRYYPKEFNSLGIIGASEAYMILVGLDLIKQEKISVKRLFKMSGRRRFSEAFDITIYNNIKFYKKYVFKLREEYNHSPGVYFLHTRFWSVCGSLVDNAITLVSNSLRDIVRDTILIEQAIYQNLDKNFLEELDYLEVEGIMTFWNKTYKD